MQDQLGQLLMIELPKGLGRPTLERLLERAHPAGLILRELPRAAGAAELAQQASRALGSTPFLGIEDEGEGPLANLFPPLPQPARQNLDEIERAADLIGRAMAMLGLNLNLAPAVDLQECSGREDKSNPMDREKSGDAEPGSTAEQVGRRAEAFVKGLTRHRVLACARSFPGLPASLRRAGADLPVVGKSMAALWREDLLPYRTLRGMVALVQLSHVAYKAYDYEFPRPAALSPGVVESLLRAKIGYRGVAMADVSAASQAARIEPGEAAVQALAAGCDLILVSGEGSTLDSVKDTVAAALESGKLHPERIEQALARIQKAKAGLVGLRKPPSQRDLAELRRGFKEFRRT